MLFTELKTQNNGTTSGCAVRHTASMPSSCNEQPELIPGLLAGLFLLSPGAPVNNCRWASIQWTWDQWELVTGNASR